MSAGPTTPRLRFGPFELELETGTLRKNGIRIRVPDQAVQVLSALLDRPGQLVGRDELYQKLWPDDVYVDFEHSLNAAVKKLRHALCDSVEKPKFIETIPRRGYKFIATVEVVSVEAPSHPAAVVSPATSTLCPDSIIPETRPTQLLNGIRLHRRSRARVVTGLAALVLLAVMGRAIVVRRTDRSVPFRRINITRLTFTGNVTASAISPDGRHVVYSASNAGLESLKIRQVATGTEAELLPPANVMYRSLGFSPDGEFIHYLRQSPGRELALYSRPTLAGAERRVAEKVTSAGNLSPDRRFAILRNLASKSTLFSVGADGGDERQLAVRRFPQVFGMFSPSDPGVPQWSPDGKIIAAPGRDFRGYYSTVLTIPGVGGPESVLSRSKWWLVQSLAWLGNGEGLIAVVNDAIGQSAQLRYISYPAGEVHNVTNDLNDYSSVSLTADSASLLTIQLNVVSDLWMIPAGRELEARQIRAATPRSSGNMNVISWAPDGHLLYVSRAGGHNDIWIAESDGHNARRLTWFGRNNLQPRVCSEGRYIVFVSDRSGKLNIWRMNIDGSDWKQLTFGEVDSRPDCGPDGRSVYYTDLAAAPQSIWKVSLDGDHARRVNDYWVVSPVVSPDGRWIACRYRDDKFTGSRIAIFPAEGGAPQAIFEFDAEWTRWANDSRSVFFTKRDRGVDNIWRQPITGGSPEQVTNFSAGLIINFDWSRDGKRLACIRGYEQNDVVLIREAR